MGQQTSRTDFEWSYTEEPHATRRKQILAKYPEIKKLMGHNPNMKWTVTGMVLFQIASAYIIGPLLNLSWPVVFLLAYCVGGVINHSMTLAIHEIAHNLAFGHHRPLANRALGILANLPIVVPMSVSFKKYHLLHHRYQGDDELDLDIPSRLEAKLFRSSATKFVWLLFQPFFYALRPLFLKPLPPQALEIINTVVQVVFNLLIIYGFGIKAFVYLASGTFLAMGVHPVAGHFISEHYMFRKGYETYSYYGVLNAITFNVGYHNEHHDFPSIPGSRLPEVKKIAPEFYDGLPCHKSWTRVLYDFVFDPDIGPYSRVKRRTPLPTGPCNGDSKGLAHDQANGISNGHANGQANGISNGHANGQVNGISNGHANGHSKKDS